MIKIIKKTAVFISLLVSVSGYAAEPTFDIDKDLLLLNYDLKTDVDDAHTIAAMDLILQSPDFKKLNYYAVSGTYGKQGGLYVPATELFDIVFNDNWTDAHMYRQDSINRVAEKMGQSLSSGGRVWVAEAGQSDFTQALILQLDKNEVSFEKDQLIVVQHSEWNENETSADALSGVKARTLYKKIADGNKEGNGTPGFNNAKYSVKALENEKLVSSKAWTEANRISAQYNGVNGRYMNESIQTGGADFSDLSETVSILAIDDVDTVAKFFLKFNREQKR